MPKGDEGNDDVTPDDVALMKAAKPGRTAVTPNPTATALQEPEDQGDADREEDASEDTDPQGEEEPEEDDAEAGLVDDNGKYLGKYDTPEQLAKAYKNAEKLIGQKGESERKLKLQLQEAGYTFDVDGNPVKAGSPQQKAESSLPPGWTVNAAGNRVNPDGIEYDYLGMPVISDDEWRDQYDEDPIKYDNLRREYYQQRDQRLIEHTNRQRQEAESHKATIVAKAKSEYNLPDEVVAAIMDDVNKTIPHMDAAWQNNPVALDLVFRASAAERIRDYYEEREKQILAGNTEALAKGKRVIAFATESSVNGKTKPDEGGSHGLTRAELAMAKNLGVSPKQYAAGKER